jgi:hypothetical protein
VTPRHRLRLITRNRMLLLALAAVAVLFIVGSVLWAQAGQQAAQQQTGVVEQQRDSAVAEKVSLAEQIKAACAAGDLRGPICDQAADVAATPVPSATGAAGRPPTAAEISAAVEAYLLANPPAAGRAPTAAEVAAAAASYLTANPPNPGRAPTVAEIVDAVGTYFATHPPPTGDPGQDGKDGRPPTAGEIRAAVDEYLAEHPPPAGEQGPQGPAGPVCPDGSTLLPVQFDGGVSGFGCVLDEQPTGPAATATPAATSDDEPPGS